MIVYILVPLIGGVIGWLTNVLAIKLLFRPLHPIKLGPVVIQGLIPKRRAEIAQAVADTVAKELVDVSGLLGQVNTAEVHEELIASIMNVVEQRGKERMPGFIPEPFKAMILEYIRKTVREELAANLPALLSDATASLQQKIDVQSIVIERIDGMDLEDIERLVLGLANRELKAIEYLGGLLGFIIGLLQLGLLLL